MKDNKDVILDKKWGTDHGYAMRFIAMQQQKAFKEKPPQGVMNPPQQGNIRTLG